MTPDFSRVDEQGFALFHVDMMIVTPYYDVVTARFDEAPDQGFISSMQQRNLEAVNFNLAKVVKKFRADPGKVPLEPDSVTIVVAVDQLQFYLDTPSKA